MAVIRCPSCGRRMLDSQGLRFCTNCGAPLQPQEATHEPEWLPDAALPAPGGEEPSGSPDVEGERALVLRPDGTVSRSPRERAVEAYGGGPQRVMELYRGGPQTGIEPYGPPMMPQPYEGTPEWLHGPQQPYGPQQYGQGQYGFTTVVTEMPGKGTLWEPTRSGIPWWFPRRVPEVAGTLIHVQTQQESSDLGGVGGVVFGIFSEMIWSMAGGGGGGWESRYHRERENAVVTVLRVRGSDGTLYDARLRGHLTGANLTLGDKLSLWGWRRRGVLAVRRGFNHSSKSIVSSSGMRSMLPMLVVLLVLAIGFYVWTTLGHLSLWPR